MFAMAKRRLAQRRSDRLDRRAVRAEWDLTVGDRFGQVRERIWEHDAMLRDELPGGGFDGPVAPPAAWMRRG